MFEFLRRWQLAGQDKAVQTAFVDDGNRLLATGGCHFNHPFVFVINVLANRLCGIGITENVRYVLADEPRFAVLLDGAYLLFFVLECNDVVFHVSAPFEWYGYLQQFFCGLHSGF